MAYHVVIRGEGWSNLVGGPPIRLRQGDVIVFPHGDPHVVSSAAGMRATPETDFLFQPHRPQLPFRLQQAAGRWGAAPDGPGAPDASLLCGFLGCDLRPFNPLLATLPRMIHVSAADAGGEDWIGHFARIATAESREKRPGGEAVLERMSEMMFVDLLRRYLQRLPEDQSGWLAGLRDRYVGRVLALMHAKPAEHWTAESLADRVGLSRSALHERFVQFIGLPPSQYLISWRMQMASRLLTASNAPLASIALDTGYESEAAFSRAFKRIVGVSPSVWRRDRGNGRQAGRGAVQAAS
jgi:AraC-like DNA-binding protein